MQESQNPIHNYNGYEVSSLGNVRHFLHGSYKLMRGSRDKTFASGSVEMLCSLDNKRHSVKLDRLVYQAFHKDYIKGLPIFHIDGSFKNNSLNNLTQQYVILNDEETEDWKNIPGYEGLYQVSRYGEVRSLDRYKYTNHSCSILKGHLMRQNNVDGYLYVGLSNLSKSYKSFAVHRLVATAFVPNPYNLSTVDHIDNNKQNNDYRNLQWLSASENSDKAVNDGLVNRCIKVKELSSGKIYRSIHDAENKLHIKSNKLHTQFYAHKHDKDFVAKVDGFEFIRVDVNA